jgi:hypothetical protein
MVELIALDSFRPRLLLVPPKDCYAIYLSKEVLTSLQISTHIKLKALVKSLISNRAVTYSLIFLFTLFLLIKGVMPAWTAVNSDFANYYVSAKLVAGGEDLSNIYDNNWFQQKIKSFGIDTPGKFAPFPPLTAWWLLPFTIFKPLAAQQVFTLINLFFLFTGIVLIKKLTNFTWEHTALILLASGLGLANNFAFGQVYLIMTVAILLSVYLMQKNHTVLPGIILGYFTCLKYFPAVIIFALLINGISPLGVLRINKLKLNADLRVVFWSTITILILCICQYLYFGQQIILEFIYSAFLPHLDGNLNGQGLYSFQFQSWDNLFRNLFITDLTYNPNPVVDFPSGRITSKLFVGIIILSLTVFALRQTRTQATNVRRLVYISLFSLASLVMLPVSATYHYILLTPAVVLLLHSRILKGVNLYLIGASYVLIGIIPYGIAFKLGRELNLFFAYPRLWLVTLIFLLCTLGIKNSAKTSHD